MANLKSSKKDVRRIAKKRVANQEVRTSLKTYVKRVRQAMDSGDVETMHAAVRRMDRAFDKAVQRGIVHKNQAARRKSRVAKAAAAASAKSE